MGFGGHLWHQKNYLSKIKVTIPLRAGGTGKKILNDIRDQMVSRLKDLRKTFTMRPFLFPSAIPLLQGCKGGGGSKILKDIKAQIKNKKSWKEILKETSRDSPTIYSLY